MSAKPLLSTEQYAAHRGVNSQTVRRWIAKGVITEACVKVGQGKKKSWRIDADQADLLWRAWQDEVDPRHKASGKAKQEEFGKVAAEDPTDVVPDVPTGGSGSAYQKAKAAHEIFRAKIARIDYEERAGEVCKVKTVRKSRFNTARRVRNAILAVPSRVTPRLCAMRDHHEILNYLTEELTKAMASLSDDLRRSEG